MARPRTEYVRESLQELNQLEARHRGTALEARIRVVRLMKERPHETIATIAEASGCSERSAHRWWQDYRRDGMAALLGARKKGALRSAGDIDHITDELAAKLRADELTTLKEIQEWLEKEHGARYTLKGVSNLLRDRLRVRRRWIFEDEEKKKSEATAAAEQKPGTGARIPEEALRFLGALPMVSDPVEWVTQFRNALKKFLGDVDHIVMAVATANGIDREVGQRHITITRNINLGSTDNTERLTSNRNALRPSEAHLENGIRAGFPIDKYHTPHLLDYYVEGVHVGSIILLRERTSKPISAETLTLMEDLRPFLTFAFSDCIVRQKDGITPSQYLTDILSKDANFTVREREVLTLRLFGAKYTQIAEQLFISVDTVRKHIKSIHAKTQTRTLSDLFARYFHPTSKR